MVRAPNLHLKTTYKQSNMSKRKSSVSGNLIQLLEREAGFVGVKTSKDESLEPASKQQAGTEVSSVPE